MKTAITGHTSGLGLALAEAFPDSIGFSRSNGYDLNLHSTRMKMYGEIDGCDVFINNAPINWNQTALLYELWEKWKNRDKIIVNIGSDAADYTQNIARPYNVQKKSLQDACLQLQHASQPCKVVLIRPSYIDTPRVSHINASKMDPKELAQFIKEVVEQKHSTFWIPVVTLYPR